ncbi:hypothetical protein EXIGLDRAFT_773068 [Exidia glandulosa HHB12029]|uniref:P-loop containing nucleoside triphosphate hydrolase protein n=1 Tax=Exidia glandulosa HHB12029 TaxID=1314781 RepID=A0A165EYZ6_EXIGL|nr:hypothetical protein EXIGLDRAFT_773068 [Exidia glandulosa HHB12029]
MRKVVVRNQEPPESSHLPQSPGDAPVDFWQMRLVYGKVQYYQLVSEQIATASQPPEICRGGLLADDFGLGKSLTVLIAIYVDLHQNHQLAPSLIAVPAGLVPFWEDQIKRHFQAGTFRICTRNGGVDDDRVKDLRDFDIVLVSTTTMTNEWEASLASTGRQEGSGLYATRFRRVVFDDVHELTGNATSMTFQAACAIKASCRWGVSATPFVVPQEMATLCQVLRAFGPLSKRETFKALIADKIVNDSMGAMELFKYMFASIALRRTAHMVQDKAIVLPALNQQTIHTRLDSTSQRAYDILEELKKDQLDNTLKWNQHLCQAALHGALLPEDIVDAIYMHGGNGTEVNNKTSSKLTGILQLIDKLGPSESAAVFSRSTAFLKILEKELQHKRTVRLDSKSSPQTRMEQVNKCGKSSGCIILISMKTGASGLDLSFVQHVIIAEPWWHRNIEHQAVGRCYTHLQTCPVTVHRLLALGTIDEEASLLFSIRSQGMTGCGLQMSEAQAKRQVFVDVVLGATMHTQVP